MFRKALLPVFALVIATSAATPAFCQNRFMDEAREKNERREEFSKELKYAGVGRGDHSS